MKLDIAIRVLAGVLSIVVYHAANADAALEVSTSQGVEFFEKRIRPILVERCYKCHSVQSEKLKGGLRLDSREGLLKGGDTRPALVPGAPDKSLLIMAIQYTDDDLQMPPKGKLSAQQIADFTTWVQMGAPWPASEKIAESSAKPNEFNWTERAQHWSFQPLAIPPIPKVKQPDWAQSAIDPFILAKLEERDLSPARPADKRTLLRRVTYDLIGLPPTPTEIGEFLADNSRESFRKVVDRLLASPHYGERWARHWLDLVRFAETAGHEFDGDYPTAYRYRDYVIRAFNADVPYNQFVIEHVAGDLLPEPRRHPTEHFNESIIGTGFWFLGEAVHSPVDILEDEAGRMDNQIDVFTKTFQGLTVACARCHDHKFDPITTKDYYALAGFLQSSRFQNAFVDPPEKMRPIIDNLVELDTKLQSVGKAWLKRSFASLHNQISHSLSELIGLTNAVVPSADRLSKELQLARKQLEHPLHALAVLCASASDGAIANSFLERKNNLLAQLRERAAAENAAREKAIRFAQFDSGTYTDWFVTGNAFGNSPAPETRIRLQPDPRKPVQRIVPGGLAHSGHISPKLQGALRSKTFTIEKNKIWLRLAGTGGTVNLIIDSFQQIRDPIYGGLKFKANTGDRLTWRSIDVAAWKGHNAYLEFLDDGDEEIVVEAIYFSDENPPAEKPNALVVDVLSDSTVNSARSLCDAYGRMFQTAILEIANAGRPQQRRPSTTHRNQAISDLSNWCIQLGLIRGNGDDGDHLFSECAQLISKRNQFEAIIPQPIRVMAMADGTPENQQVYIRGNYRTRGDAVPRRFLEIIGDTNRCDAVNGSGRLALAEQMVSPSNPLLARVIVNRVWEHHFGEGIVRTPDDFGKMGQVPTHPELLDFLATEFMREGWSIKKLHRLMLLSSTYQMASQAEPSADELDPENKLLHRMPIRRLEAEIVRDAILAVSGRLDPTVYGKSVPVHLTSFMNGRGRPESSGPLDGDGRRSIYLNVRRNFLNPMFLAFDYPVPFSTMGKRTVSNVPAQALALMNNPFVMQQAEFWARRVVGSGERTIDKRIEGLYVAAFGRSPDAEELSAARTFLDARGDTSQADLGVWRDFCHVLFNVKEFIFIN